MSCSISSASDIEEIRKLSLSGSGPIPQLHPEKIVHLPRGGCIIKTKIGNVQFGMPPETVKDSMVLGLEVPTNYIIPTTRFDPRVCLNVSEFEFPAYYNFFCKKTRVNLICTKSAQEAIQIVFQETLLGPLSFEDFENEFDPSFDKEAIPNLKGELSHFAKNPFEPGNPLTMDTLIKFTLFDDNGIADLGNGVIVEQSEGLFIIHEDGKKLGIIPDAVEINVDDEHKEHILPKNSPLFTLSETQIMHLHKGFHTENFKPITFNPPTFGITILGCSHGFDPKGSTSGYIIWINGRGVMVDPTPFSTHSLKRLGIPSILIEWVIISHCHADHDAGTFQKILDSSRVEVITTKTIMNSFLRKYSALTDLPIEKIRNLFIFRPALIGAPMHVNGAQFKFFYALHTIPCVGFEVEFQGKSIYFSGDTFYDPIRMQQLIEKGVMTQKRYEDLTSNKFNHTLILHEAGVPPIHTPISVLVALPDDVIKQSLTHEYICIHIGNVHVQIKKRMYLVHTAKKDIPEGSGLKATPEGIENTIILDVKRTETMEIFEKLDIVSSIDIFQNLPARKVKDLLDAGKTEFFKEGTLVIKKDVISDKMYIILRGIAKVYDDQPGEEFERYYQIGDYFGEGCLKRYNKRSANVLAYTDLTLLSIRASDFWFIFGEGESVIHKLLNLTEKRKFASIKVLQKNSLFSQLAPSQKVQLEMILNHITYEAGQEIWKEGEPAKIAILLEKGELEVSHEDEEETYNSGAFIGEVMNIINNGVHNTRCIATVKSTAYFIKSIDLIQFLEKNPKLLIILSGIDHVEQ